MGMSMMPAGKGGRRAVDSEINLIPMIDLLIVNVAFLLITAVWTQLARLSVTQQMPGQDAPTEAQPDEKVKLFLRINDQGYVLASSAGDSMPIEKRSGEYDYDRLRESLKAIKERDPERQDINVTPEDGVQYLEIVRAMDIALQQDFPELSLSDGSTGT